MNNGAMITSILSQLAVQSPVFLAFLVAGILGLVFWGRSAKASVLMILAAGVLFLVTLVQLVVTQYLAFNRESMHFSTNEYATATMVIAVVMNLLRAGAFGMWIAAVVVGRRKA